MTDYMVTLTYAGDVPEDVTRVAELLGDAVVTVARVPGRGFTLTVPVEGANIDKAVMVGLGRGESVADLEPVGVEVLTEDEYVRRAEEPTLPEVVSAPEIADMLGGISRQRVHQLRATAAFPAPLFELRSGAVWDRRAVERFARGWVRKPGRPAKVKG